MSTVCVHGLGYIGLPTAAMLANYGHEIYGYDANSEVTNRLRNGTVHLDEPGLRAFVTEALESDRLQIVDGVRAAEYHVICVPTPFDARRKIADLDYVTQAARAIVPHLRPGDTVILESTVPPGTTEEDLLPILETSGMVAGEEFALAHCPETVLPGNIVTELKENNRIVGGVNRASADAAVRLYESFVEGEIRTTPDATTAEFVKLIQNTFRDTNIALANEIAKIAHDYGVDSRRAIDLANEHPRVDLLVPGPGVGGHCLPVDPWFLGHGSDRLELIATARRVNDSMGRHVIDLLREEIGSLDGTKLAILGVAYKGNVGDTRNSPGLRLARELDRARTPSERIAANTRRKDATPERPNRSPDGGSEEQNEDLSDVDVALHDPHVVDATLRLDSYESAIEDASAVIITADHDEFESIDPETSGQLVRRPVVVDTKGIIRTDEWSDAGWTVVRI